MNLLFVAKMPVHLCLISVLVFLSSAGISSMADGGDGDNSKSSREPAQQFLLELGGQKIPLQLDKLHEASIDGKPVKLRLKLKPTRLFSAGGIQFEYPTEFLFKFDNDGMETWSIEGPDILLMIQNCHFLDPMFVVEQIEDEYGEQFGEAVTQGREVEMMLGGRLLKGRRVDFKAVGESFRVTILAVQSNGKNLTIVLQDSLEDDGAHSAEYDRIVALLKKTLQFDRSEPKKGDGG
mgnify:CR=1 FL=1